MIQLKLPGRTYTLTETTSIEYMNIEEGLVFRLREYTREQILDIIEIFKDWVTAPDLEAKRLNSYQKEFHSFEDLLTALKGNYEATDCRRLEETLAYAILGNFKKFEEAGLDDAFEAIYKKASNEGLLKDMEKHRFYGDVGTISYSDYGSLTAVKDYLSGIVEPVERLYKKVSQIHRFGLCHKRGTIPISKFESESEKYLLSMRQSEIGNSKKRSKHSLNESHGWVKHVRGMGVSVWGGTSGSTRLMINGLLYAGFSSPEKLTVVAYCISTFFHVLPTTVSCSHTLYEVMDSAFVAAPSIAITDPNIRLLLYEGRVPTQGYLPVAGYLLPPPSFKK